MTYRPPNAVRSLGDLTDDEVRDWHALARRERLGYFASPLWVRTWHAYLAPEAPDEVGVWRDASGNLEAFAPISEIREAVLPQSARFNLHIRAWQNAGAGLGGADHLSFACVPERRRDVIGWALDRQGTVRLLQMDESWAGDLPAGRGGTRAATHTYRVDLTAGDRPGSRQHWSQIGRRRRRLVEQGITFDMIIGKEVDAVALRDVVDLHGTRNLVLGRKTSFTQGRLPFHLALARGADDRSRSAIVRAMHEGRMVGALYGFVHDDQFLYYQSGWSPEFQKWSLGSVVMAESFDAARSLGCTTFDMLRGDEPYKLRFGAVVSTDHSYTRYSSTGGLLLRARNSVDGRHGTLRWKQREVAADGLARHER